MRVKENFYISEKFRRPEAVKRIVDWCNNREQTARADNNLAQYLVAKRIKSLCLRHYNIHNKRGVYFCDEWEQNPRAMSFWILNQFKDGKCKMKRVDPKGPFSPENVILIPLN